MADIDDQIDRLYQGDLEGFVRERNALAKAARRAEVKALQKPSLPAWAVNQVYWRHRPLFDRLVACAQAGREQHRRVLSGQPADVAAAEAAHRGLVSEALGVARQVLREAGHPMTPSTLDAVGRTLAALPTAEPNGRLVAPLTPAGLEALAGLAMTAPPSPLRLVERRADAPVTTDAGARERAAHEARERAAEARRERQRAAQAAVDAARADLDRAEAAVTEAERALEARRVGRDRAAAAYERARRALSD